MKRYDIFNNEVEIGDTIAFNPPKYKGLVTGKLIKFTPKGYTVLQNKHYYTTTVFQIAKYIKKGEK